MAMIVRHRRRNYANSVVKQVKQGKLNPTQRQQVKGLIKGVQELKYFSANSSLAAISSAPVIQGAFFDIPQGDTDQSRDGDRFQWCGSVDLRFQLMIADTTNLFRICLFQWHPSSVPTAGDLMLNGPSGAIDVFSHYSHDNRQQFKVLWDKTYTLIGNATTSSVPNTTKTTIFARKQISLKRATKNAQMAGGTTAGTNKLYLYFISDSTLVNHPTITLSTKVFFRDS